MNFKKPNYKTALLLCGVATIGWFAVAVTITSHNLEELTVQKIQDKQFLIQEKEDHIKKMDADAKFVAMESQLKPAFHETEDYSELDETDESEETEPIPTFFPGYAEYAAAWSIPLYASSKEEMTFWHRMSLHGQFKSICDLVEDLDAGLDPSTRSDGNYSGKYHGGAEGGIMSDPANVEVMLKACGDEDLKYLDRLEELSKADVSSEESVIDSQEE